MDPVDQQYRWSVAPLGERNAAIAPVEAAFLTPDEVGELVDAFPCKSVICRCRAKDGAAGQQNFSPGWLSLVVVLHRSSLRSAEKKRGYLRVTALWELRTGEAKSTAGNGPSSSICGLRRGRPRRATGSSILVLLLISCLPSCAQPTSARPPCELPSGSTDDSKISGHRTTPSGRTSSRPKTWMPRRKSSCDHRRTTCDCSIRWNRWNHPQSGWIQR